MKLQGARRAAGGGDVLRVLEDAGMDLRGKRVIAIGERDGVQGTAIAECARSAGAEVLLDLTLCYV